MITPFSMMLSKNPRFCAKPDFLRNKAKIKRPNVMRVLYFCPLKN